MSNCAIVASSQPWLRKQRTEYWISARRPSTVAGLVRTRAVSGRVESVGVPNALKM